jgi:hypothetical protein
MKPTDPSTANQAEQTKLIAIYRRVCLDDQMMDDDPRRPVIAVEALTSDVRQRPRTHST